MARLIVRGTRDNPKVYADYRDPCGTRRTKLLRGIQTKTEGKKRLLEIEARLVAGKPGLPEDDPAVVSASVPTASTCGPLIEQWLATLQNRNADDGRSRVRRHLVPAWGKVPLAKVQELAPVMSWIDLMLAAGDLSEQSMRHNLNLLSRFLAWAIERGFATANPVRMIPQGRRPKGSAGGADDAPWIRDDETVHRLMEALPAPVSLMFYLGNRSGLRPGRSRGSRWRTSAGSPRASSAWRTATTGP